MIAPQDTRALILEIPKAYHDVAQQTGIKLALVPENRAFKEDGAQVVGGRQVGDMMEILIVGPRLPVTRKGGKIPQCRGLLDEYIQ